MHDHKRQRVMSRTEHRRHCEIRCNRLSLNYREIYCHRTYNNGRCNKTHSYAITAICIHSRYEITTLASILLVLHFLLNISRSQTPVTFRSRIPFRLQQLGITLIRVIRDGVHKIANDGTLRCGNHNRTLVSVSDDVPFAICIHICPYLLHITPARCNRNILILFRFQTMLA